jgi:hypothetical protein
VLSKLEVREVNFNINPLTGIDSMTLKAERLAGFCDRVNWKRGIGGGREIIRRCINNTKPAHEYSCAGFIVLPIAFEVRSSRECVSAT